MRFLKRAGVALVVLLSFVVSLVLGVVVHLNHPLTRTVVREQVSALLADVFAGDIVIDEISELSLSHFEAKATVLHEGRNLIAAESITAHFSLVHLLRGIRANGIIPIEAVEVRDATVLLDGTETTDLLIVDAFAMPDDGSDTSSSSTVRGVSITAIELHDVRVTRATANEPLIADVTNVSGTLVAGETTTIDVHHAAIAFQLPDVLAPVHSTAQVHVFVGDDVVVQAEVDTAPLPSDALVGLVPDLRRGSLLAAHAWASYRLGEVDARAHASVWRPGEPGSAAVFATARSSDRIRGHVGVWLDQLNGARLSEQLPVTTLDVHGSISFDAPMADTTDLVSELAAQGHFEWTSASRVGGEQLPEGQALATLHGGDLMLQVSAAEQGVAASAQSPARSNFRRDIFASASLRTGATRSF